MRVFEIVDREVCADRFEWTRTVSQHAQAHIHQSYSWLLECRSRGEVSSSRVSHDSDSRGGRREDRCQIEGETARVE